MNRSHPTRYPDPSSISSTDRARFWSRVIIAGEDECWNWDKEDPINGYGYFGFGGQRYGAHRVSYVICKGAIAKGLLVLHSCDNRRCVNPRHLRLGTHKENSHDALARNRRPKEYRVKTKYYRYLGV